MYQFVVLMGCVLLDFVVVIIVLLVTSSESHTENGTHGQKNRGRTLI